MKKLMFLSLAVICLSQSCKESDKSYLDIHNTQLSSKTNGTEGSWIRKADLSMSIGRSFTVGFSIGDKGYIGTGAANDDAQQDFWEYDPKKDSWTQKADFAGLPRTSAVGFSIGNKGYIGTGYNNDNRGVYLKDFWQYNPDKNCWTRKADFKGTARYSAIGLNIGDKGYIGTGNVMNAETSDFWEYNPKTNAWFRKADFPGGERSSATAFSIGTKGYLGTGVGTGTDHKDFWEYNPTTDSWSKKADFGGSERRYAASFSLEGLGYIGTGLFNSTTDQKDLWEYNPIINTWVQKADLVGEARWAATGFSVGNKGYIGFGFGSEIYNDLWQFSRDSGI
jgi:N-acetylneuraminic acid mutarotase